MRQEDNDERNKRFLLEVGENVEEPMKVVPSEAEAAVAGNRTVPNNATAAAMMLFNDSSSTAIQSHQQPQQLWYEPYKATLCLVVLIHLLWLKQWNQRKTRKDVLVSYKRLVQHKQWHVGLVAFLSHPPSNVIASSTRNNNQSSSSNVAISYGNHEEEETTTSNSRRRLTRCLSFAKRAWFLVMSSCQPLTLGHLSGLPLLAYNSHLLWLCRALEPMYNTTNYVLVWIGLLFVALLLELRLTRGVLYKLHYSMNRHSETNRTSRHAVLHRTIGTLTMLTSGLLVVYRAAFPFVPLPVLPFVRLPPAVSDLFLVIILTVLSWQSHPVTSVVCGYMSGLLWSAGVTSFLASKYWGGSLVVLLTIMMALSMRASVGLAKYVPFVDYVAWDHRGVMRQQDEQNERVGLSSSSFHPNNERDEEDEHDIESGGTTRPLLRRRRSGENDEILRGRLPFMDMESAEMDDTTIPTTTASRTPGLSRRGGGGSNSMGDGGSSPNQTTTAR